jgi:hypothetical protein
MSAFTFDFDLEDDLDNSFDAIIPQKPSAVLSTDKTLVSDDGSGGSIPAEEITLSSLVRHNSLFSLSFVHFFQSYLVRQRSSPLSPKRSRIRP